MRHVEGTERGKRPPPPAPTTACLPACCFRSPVVRSRHLLRFCLAAAETRAKKTPQGFVEISLGYLVGCQRYFVASTFVRSLEISCLSTRR